jgi:hypothetical protein
MNFWKRMRRDNAARAAEPRPWIATAILRSIGGRSQATAADTESWQCATAPAFVLMFRTRRRRARRNGGRS